ncbi:FecR family protein [Sphingomonas sp. J315]|uniref:FecR family protein n=1 Tax=Sphingomonas sp. J315 TaxID=2898433 RepID=UPI0021ADC077|nr:FecR domain-containing protein [Sphingomonas sp. J315]UUY00788.1 FecR domain-containing protein [Sphingomonas sp. J315]
MNRGSEAEGEAAARWLARLNARSVTTDELDRFYAWRRDPANAAAYARVERVWREAHRLESDPTIATAVDEALERPQQRGFLAGLVRRRLLVAGLTAIPVAVTGVAAWWTFGQAEVHETVRGERLAFALADGTQVQLNTDSRIRVSFSDGQRVVELERGEALFAVKRDPARPFIVEAGTQSVRALGTSFSTRRSDDALRVVLIEGQVAVNSTGSAEVKLTRSGGAAVARPGKPIVPGMTDPAAATAWTRGKLLFRQTPLASAVSEVNRYSARRIVLGSQALGARRVDGNFEIGDSESFVAAVTTIFDLSVRTQDTDIILEPRPAGDAKKS